MGCASSKQIDAATAVTVYRPAPSSFAVFDINAIQEPWAMIDHQTPAEQQDEKNQFRVVHAPIFEKLNKFELVTDAPRSWDEVSKALEDLKPTLDSNKNNKSATSPKPEEAVSVPAHSPAHDSSPPMKRVHRKSFSFHTLDELDAKVSFNPKPTQLMKTESLRNTEFNKPELKKTESKKSELGIGTVETERVAKRVRENMFIVRDRLEREREGKEARFEELMKSRRDPLSQYPEICPPGGADSVVLYTTSLGGVRRTYEDCNRVRLVLEGHRVVFDERDVSLHGGFLNELNQLLGEREKSVPRLFVKGRYVGGVNEVVELNELGKLGRMLSYARVERGVGRQACEGCGGARFVPCLECAGSCKVVVGGGKKERCPKCNENGLVHCPSCI